jgi:DnaK suppressor protein
MNAIELEQIRNKITEEIEKTEKSVVSYKEITKPIAPDCAIGRVSRMDAINNKSVAEAALRQAEEKLSKLKYVLAKVDEEGFGLCAKCGKPIPLGRILLMPQSRHCVACAR